MKYQPYVDFTAQSANIQTLLTMYEGLDRFPDRPEVITPIVVFMAFAVEAYLNTLGFRHIQKWSEIERIPWKAKVEALYKNADSKPDWGSRDLQFCKKLFKLRDLLAHGKPSRWTTDWVDDYEQARAILAFADFQPTWYRQLNKAWAAKAKVAFTSLMAGLGALYGLQESDHLEVSQGGIAVDD